jgi:hypothetical protein
MEIKLNGKYSGVTIVSPEDYDHVIKYNWSQDKKGYVKATINRKSIRLSHFITNIDSGTLVDHINSNKLDHQRENLRPHTHLGNANNRLVLKTKKYTNLRYVFYKKSDKKFTARITYNKKSSFLGYFDTDLEAAHTADMYIVHELNCEKTLNFPEKLNEYKNTEYKPKNIKKSIKYYGVSKISKHNSYRASLQYKKEFIFILQSKDPIKCAKAYDKYIVQNQIPVKKLNFPQDYPDYSSKIIRTFYEIIPNDSKTIKLILYNDKYCFIDIEDYDKIKFYKCIFDKNSGTTKINVEGTKYTLSRYIMDITDPNIIIDHIDRNPLNNKRINLRISNCKKILKIDLNQK